MLVPELPTLFPDDSAFERCFDLRLLLFFFVPSSSLLVSFDSTPVEPNLSAPDSSVDFFLLRLLFFLLPVEDPSVCSLVSPVVDVTAPDSSVDFFLLRLLFFLLPVEDPSICPLVSPVVDVTAGDSIELGDCDSSAFLCSPSWLVPLADASGARGEEVSVAAAPFSKPLCFLPDA